MEGVEWRRMESGRVLFPEWLTRVRQFDRTKSRLRGDGNSATHLFALPKLRVIHSIDRAVEGLSKSPDRHLN